MTDLVVAAERPTIEELVALYGAVGWSAYTADPDALACGIAGSASVVTARADGALVGLARVISDGATIAYLQDVLVDPGWQGRGVGSLLVDAALAPFALVRQQVLLTDDEPGQRAFYESLGFTELRDVSPGGLRGFVRFRPA